MLAGNIVVIMIEVTCTVHACMTWSNLTSSACNSWFWTFFTAR